MNEEWENVGYPGLSRAINSMASHSGWGFDPLPLKDVANERVTSVRGGSS